MVGKPSPCSGGGPERTVLVVYGTRPEAIKMAPVVRALAASPLFRPVVAVTGQHRSMLDQVNTLFGIVPDFDLDVLQQGQTLAGVTTRSLGGLEATITQVQPHIVIVQGDTTTTFTGSLAAFYLGVPIVHLEAGLRTNDPTSPFPEEINRRLTSQLADLHLAPTPTSRDNLLAEGIKPDTVFVVGNTVIDSLLWVVNEPMPTDDPLLAELERTAAGTRPVLLVTAHRRESWGEPMRNIGHALARLATDRPDLLIVFPIHRNPTVRAAIMPAVSGLANVIVSDPVDYAVFARLMNRATIVLTDSGGVQEEAPSLGKPVLVMRDITERPEGVEAGTVALVGTDPDRIVDSVGRLLDDPLAYAVMAEAVNPYGDGEAARRTVAVLAHYFGVGAPADEFVPRSSLPADPRAIGVPRQVRTPVTPPEFRI
jgi:UDP-N-acetylglucosamine 2-epimerase (non-hydrolysing)